MKSFSSFLLPLVSLLLVCFVDGFQTNHHQQAITSFKVQEKRQWVKSVSPLPAISNTKRSEDYPITTMRASVIDDSSSSSATVDSGIDFKAFGKYLLGLGVQMSLITAFMTGLDKITAMLSWKVPFGLNVVMFYFFALKSRVFNPLSNQRPQPKTKEVDGEEVVRKMPTWTPPGFIFPIVWLLLIGPLRAVTSSMIYKTTGSYTNKAILSLMLHLSIGDIWNTINNVERRYGTSVLFMVFVWTSAAFSALQYGKVLPLAGKLLSLKLIWLSIAASLIVRTWQINPDPKTEKPYSILPRVNDDAETKIVWFSKTQDN